MKRLFLLTSALLVLLYSCAQKPSSSLEKVAPANFQEKLKATPDVQLVDVRTPEEFSEGHLKGAKNLDYNSEGFEASLESLQKDKPVMVYCFVGGRSGQAAKLMVQKGFTQVIDMQGGYKKWTEEGLPIQNPGKALNKEGISETDYNHLTAKGLVLIDFNAPWCPPCRKMKPFMDQLETKMTGSLKVVPLNADENTVMVKKMQIDELPTLLLYKEGKLVMRHIGFIDEANLIKEINSKK